MTTLVLIALLLLIVVPPMVGYVLLARWLDRRWIDPWLRRRVGMPPRQSADESDGQ